MQLSGETVMPTVKLGTSRQIVIPKKLHEALGLEAGDYLEVEIIEGNKLLVTPKTLVDRHPEIDKRLAEAEEDVNRGRMSKPFKSVKALKQHLDAVSE
jgi:AbrB family looped-hinge helix DNA binding protein